MAIAINGSGTMTGISVGGLPDGIVDSGTLATNSVDSAELIDGAIDASHLASGAVTTPPEACNFHVTNDHVYNITGQGGEYTCAFNTEISDVGSNFNTSTYTFTAPATGLYQLSFGIKIHGLEHGTVDAIVLYLITSNRGYYNHLEGYNHTFSESNRGGSFLVDMDASDTAYMTMRVNGQSAVNADFKSGSYFSGFRVT